MVRSLRSLTISAWLFGVLVPLFAGDETRAQRLTFTTPDGLQIEATVDVPDTQVGSAVKRVVILVHGSGSHSMDADLTAVTREQKPNLFFRTLGARLARQGFAVFRYNKRNFQLTKYSTSGNPGPAEIEQLTEAYRENPLKFHVADVLAAVDAAESRFPDAQIFLLGHSEGTYVALQAARQSYDVQGVALIGFAEYSTSTLAFEQAVYRPMAEFRGLDSDHDGRLDSEELSAESTLAASLSASLSTVDQDADQAISLDEFKAANFANLLVSDVFAAFRRQEGLYPRSSDIIRDADYPVLIFQGMLDNQTPAYHALALQLLLRQLDADADVHFCFFEGLGHALDPREGYSDLQFDVIDEDALETVANSMDAHFGGHEGR